MKDPKIIELIKQFDKEVKALNLTWNKLQGDGVYVRMEIKGTNSYNDPKFLNVTEYTQFVKYHEEKQQ